jgi:hypothetical protein
MGQHSSTLQHFQYQQQQPEWVNSHQLGQPDAEQQQL